MDCTSPAAASSPGKGELPPDAGPDVAVLIRTFPISQALTLCRGDGLRFLAHQEASYQDRRAQRLNPGNPSRFAEAGLLPCDCLLVLDLENSPPLH